LEAELKNTLNKDVACLIKGSRFMKLDKLADALAVGGEA
jgi:UDP-N-acetylmuramoyl-tripeptide--D-alanyl-D-alanine ligase